MIDRLDDFVITSYTKDYVHALLEQVFEHR